MVKTNRLELRNKNNKIIIGRTFSYDDKINSFGDVVKRFFEIAYAYVSDEKISKSHLVIR